MKQHRGKDMGFKDFKYNILSCHLNICPISRTNLECPFLLFSWTIRDLRKVNLKVALSDTWSSDPSWGLRFWPSPSHVCLRHNDVSGAGSFAKKKQEIPINLTTRWPIASSSRMMMQIADIWKEGSGWNLYFTLYQPSHLCELMRECNAVCFQNPNIATIDRMNKTCL